ncbi:MAG: glycosyltransferase family 4 protein [Moorea sp. SIO4E2]|uniref:glycosyltransferase n=1 Tax=Moorena sp. SIO4E2 TaxID=2607826 RepID=UPI0013B7F506|nr:glycosyltransferase [Moorena sp. SIO4E2]NEQ05166.1 glycosyltransferase family 4 protein [Moorena sp. SIO4E2]
MMNKLRVTYVLSHYPQISETYIESELEAIWDDFEIQIISMTPAYATYQKHFPYRCIKNPFEIKKEIEKFKPDVLHTHWLSHIRDLAYLAGFFANGENQIPFTVRSHSFDVLDPSGRIVQAAVPFINSELCLGILSFPFAREILESHGVKSEKIHESYPVMNFKRFYDRSANGESVMNVGACIPKKKMEDFLELAKKIPNREFNLYALGYNSPSIASLNKEMGKPVNVVSPVEPSQMLAEYKKHNWLVYTACHDLKTVGWPVAVAEAQAAGLGVCFPNIRPDIKEYVGEAGFLYDSISDVAEIISNPPSKEIIEKGFAQAKKSDISLHKNTLISLWKKSSTASRRINAQNSSISLNIVPWGKDNTILEARIKEIEWVSEFYQAAVPGSTVLVAGNPDDWNVDMLFREYKTVPFIGDGNKYWGAPSDSEQAIQELIKVSNIVDFIVFPWHVFWWLDYYENFKIHLKLHYCWIVKNNFIIVFKI